ncbi:MAG: DUF2306 domain-containing protein, partial [Acidobacteria bacterium]|nr:DUF2306 domain-containing protein [Acidobacteriota bacterium]
MSASPLLIVHICGGTLALFAGTAAMTFRKGSYWHRQAGSVFVGAMLVMSLAAAYMAALKHDPANLSGGILTFYLILTGWITARRRGGKTSKYDLALLLIPLALGSFTIFNGMAKLRTPGPPPDGVPAEMNFFMGAVMLLACAGDIRMLVRGGIFGSQRLARHLWRMCFGFFIATGSFFLGPANRPVRFLSTLGLRQPVWRTVLQLDVRLVLAVLPLLLLIFWILRVKFSKAYRKPSVPNQEIYAYKL